MIRVTTAKRLVDITGSIVGLALTAPLFPILAAAIKLDSKGSVFFTQTRIGEATPDHTQVFTMVKFRSMAVDAEKNGAAWATKNDPRVTKVGNFLRKTRLDELPQLWNVLKGDMSLVGPRPERPGFYQTLNEAIPFFAERTYGIKPGITGLAQVSQGYDTSIEDVRSKVGFDYAYSLQLDTIATWLHMDLLIMRKTVGVMVGKKGQ